MAHQTPNPHDAEEALRPALSNAWETREALAEAKQSTNASEWLGAALNHVAVLERALGETLDLLGVPHA